MSTEQLRPLRLLCFDGGGVGGLSSLFILRDILRRTQRGQGDNRAIPLPCDYFDMICGTGTGGLIAIMLGKLRMSVDDAIDEYVKLTRVMFTSKKWFWKNERYSAQVLEQSINLIIGGRARDLRWPEAATNDGLQLVTEDIGKRVMMKGNDQGLLHSCKVFVCALNSRDTGADHIIRTYGDHSDTSGFTVWEAVRATTATPLLFKPLVIKKGSLNAEYIGGEAEHNNPIKDLLNEASREFSERQVGFILSLGAGQRNIIQLPRAGIVAKRQLFKVLKLLQEIATDCDETHQDVGTRFLKFPKIYFRFNVDQGTQEIGMEEWKKQGDILAHTDAYMRRNEVDRCIADAVDSFRQNRTPISVGQAAGHARKS